MGTDKEGTRLWKIESKVKASRDTKIRGEQKGRGGGGTEVAAGSTQGHGARSLCQVLEIKVELQRALG